MCNAWRKRFDKETLARLGENTGDRRLSKQAGCPETYPHVLHSDSHFYLEGELVAQCYLYEVATHLVVTVMEF